MKWRNTFRNSLNVPIQCVWRVRSGVQHRSKIGNETVSHFMIFKFWLVSDVWRANCLFRSRTVRLGPVWTWWCLSWTSCPSAGNLHGPLIGLLLCLEIEHQPAWCFLFFFFLHLSNPCCHVCLCSHVSSLQVVESSLNHLSSDFFLGKVCFMVTDGRWWLFLFMQMYWRQLTPRCST